MRIAVVGVSRAGAALAKRLACALPGGEPYLHTPEQPVGVLLPRLFGDPSVDGLVVVLALGATVRLLAPHLGNKDDDPAVVAVDDQGRFAVALVSGHRGGANVLAERVADAIGATAVVTTASDGAGLLAVDLLGADEAWRIEATPEAVRHAAAAVVNGAPVGVYQDAGARAWRDGGIPAGVRWLERLEDASAHDLVAVLMITDRLLSAPNGSPWRVVYRPPTLVVGIGCSRGATEDEIGATIDLALEQGGLARASLAHVATIDRRHQEPGLRAYAARLGLAVSAFSAQELAQVVSVPTPSEVVRQAVGTPGVCEPAALLASGAAELLVPKVKTGRVTAAIARIVGS